MTTERIGINYNIPSELLLRVSKQDLDYEYLVDDLVIFVRQLLDDRTIDDEIRNKQTLTKLKVIIEHMLSTETSNQVITKLQQLLKDIEESKGVYKGDEIIFKVTSNLEPEYVEFEKIQE